MKRGHSILKYCFFQLWWPYPKRYQKVEQQISGLFYSHIMSEYFVPQICDPPNIVLIILT